MSRTICAAFFLLSSEILETSGRTIQEAVYFFVQLLVTRSFRNSHGNPSDRLRSSDSDMIYSYAGSAGARVSRPLSPTRLHKRYAISGPFSSFVEAL